MSGKGKIDNERVEMPLECRSLADLHEKGRRGPGGGGEGRSQCGLLSSHGLHTFASPHLSLGHAAPPPLPPDFHIACNALQARLRLSPLGYPGSWILVPRSLLAAWPTKVSGFFLLPNSSNTQTDLYDFPANWRCRS